MKTYLVTGGTSGVGKTMAKEQLTTTQLTIIEIAYKLGFEHRKALVSYLKLRPDLHLQHLENFLTNKISGKADDAFSIAYHNFELPITDLRTDSYHLNISMERFLMFFLKA